MEVGARRALIGDVIDDHARPLNYGTSPAKLDFSGFFVRVGVGVSGRVMT